MMEYNPELSYEFVKRAIIAQVEKEAGKLELDNAIKELIEEPLLGQLKKATLTF